MRSSGHYRSRQHQQALSSLTDAEILRFLNQNSLYFIQTELIIPAVMQPGGAGALVVSYLLRDLQLAPDAVLNAEAGAKMMEYNKALQKAGVLLALDGRSLRPWAHAFPTQMATRQRPTDRCRGERVQKN